MTLEKFLETYPNNLISPNEYLLHCGRTYTTKFWNVDICSLYLQNILDNVHCVMGMVDEFNEFNDTIREGCDSNKMIDEMGDIFWYIGNYCNFNKIPFDKLEIPNVQYKGEFEKLLGIHKKELAYFKSINVKDCENLVRTGITYLCQYLEADSILLDYVLFMNLKKLYIRYPEKFESELAINKDIETEYKNTFE